jgi:hypothetical protein
VAKGNIDKDRNDDSSQEDDMSGLLRKPWTVIEGGLPVKAQRDNLEGSTRANQRRRALLKLLRTEHSADPCMWERLQDILDREG